MHEASLMKNLMARIDDIARAENARRVTAVSVWLGALSHMSASHFTEHFEESSLGTIAQGASLDIAVSTDTNDENAQDIVVKSVTVDT